MFKLQNECENIVVNEEYLELEVDVDNRLDLNVANKKSCCVFIKIKRAKSINVSVEVKENTHCTYLIYNDIDVFVDGRADLYSGEVYQDYQTLSRLKPSFSKVIDKYKFDYYIVPRDIGLTTYLKEKYEIIYKDKECLIFKAK